MSQEEVILWSGLIRQEWRKEFHCPGDLLVTNEDFAAALRDEIMTNRIPAQISTRVVNWDGTGKRQTRVLLRYSGTEAETDVVRLLAGVDMMGNYAYVEGKTYFMPPQLPAQPQRKRAVPTDWFWVSLLFIVGGILTFGMGTAGEFGECCSIPGVIMFGIGVFMLVYNASLSDQRDQAREWNDISDRAAWDRERAWDRWQREILTSAYLARTDDTLGRFVQAVSSCIDTVTQKLFLDHNAELRKESESERTREEIEQELKKRRAEAFG